MLLRHNSCTVLPDLSNQERITHIRRDEAGKTYLLQTTATGFLTKLLGVESSCNRKHRIQKQNHCKKDGVGSSATLCKPGGRRRD